MAALFVVEFHIGTCEGLPHWVKPRCILRISSSGRHLKVRDDVSASSQILLSRSPVWRECAVPELKRPSNSVSPEEVVTNVMTCPRFTAIPDPRAISWCATPLSITDRVKPVIRAGVDALHPLDCTQPVVDGGDHAGGDVVEPLHAGSLLVDPLVEHPLSVTGAFRQRPG